MRRTDRDILLSALGHELTHIKGNDYLLNLIGEFIYLSICFHPAASLIKRRIKETRESCCDEFVTEKLLEPAADARALVRLAESAVVANRATMITIGMFDAHDLEKRIMQIINKPKLTVRRKNLLLSTASFFFAAVFSVSMTFSIIPATARKAIKENDQTEEKLGSESQTVDEVQQIASPTELRALTQNSPDFAKTIEQKKSESAKLRVKLTPQQVLPSSTAPSAPLVLPSTLPPSPPFGHPLPPPGPPPPQLARFKNRE